MTPVRIPHDLSAVDHLAKRLDRLDLRQCFVQQNAVVVVVVDMPTLRSESERRHSVSDLSFAFNCPIIAKLDR